MSAKEMRATMLMNRMERKAMADNRAMEEQMERQNPISGTGATPSMGLSQVRGGKKMMKNAAEQGKQLAEHLASLHGGAYAKQFHEGMKGGFRFSDIGHGIADVVGMFGLGKEKEMDGGRFRISDIGHGISDVAGMFGLGRCGDNEKIKGGLHTGRYEGEGKCGSGKITAAEKKALMSVLAKHEMNGGAMFSRDEQDFSSHMKGGRAVGAGTGGRRDPVPYGRPQKPKMELMGEGRFSNIGHRVSDVAGMLGLGKEEMDGGRFRISDIGHGISDVAGMFGLGKEKKQKRVVGAGDGRRKRAEIVRKVMAEKGMKMIDASKYVKEHGLYKP